MKLRPAIRAQRETNSRELLFRQFDLEGLGNDSH